MSQLQIKKKLPLGLAWTWVKYSFATFREKPINFLLFGIAFVVFSLLPFIGSLVSVMVLARIYLSIAKIESNQPLGLKLDFLEIFRRRNIVSLGLFNMLFDMIVMTIFRESLAAMNIDMANSEMLADHRVIGLLLGLSLFRAVFFGISLVIVTFNPEIPIFQALRLNWRFLFNNASVILLSLLLLLPFLIVPLYFSSLLALSMENNILFSLASLVMLIFMLLFIVIISIFSYKLYKDGVVN